ncbi:hypothetical protein [Spirosoma radiotolerans]|uniref:Uncharacterized protein n=1 Tax=Spirosoma radiotolerans TaxID=1379870 RepID=A0A0E3V9L2_9BACT|nr:hypothetical protein [Spirosoma radiotolerans]AKD57762.1 hypothetical protein SD10_25565 [Spirosoma radiotolerans]
MLRVWDLAKPLGFAEPEDELGGLIKPSIDEMREMRYQSDSDCLMGSSKFEKQFSRLPAIEKKFVGAGI